MLRKRESSFSCRHACLFPPKLDFLSGPITPAFRPTTHSPRPRDPGSLGLWMQRPNVPGSVNPETQRPRLAGSVDPETQRPRFTGSVDPETQSFDWMRIQGGGFYDFISLLSHLSGKTRRSFGIGLEQKQS